MPRECITGEAQDQAALYSLGLLDAELVPGFERHLESCASCRGEIRAFASAASQLALATAVEPPPQLRARVLSAVVSKVVSKLEEPPRSIFIQRAGQGAWIDSPFPGVSAKPLFHDPKTGLLTQVVRLEPGARYPSHRHSKPESCYVLEGDVQIGGDSFGMGDFTLAPAGTLHGEVSSRGGCLLLLTSNPHDEVVV